MTKNEYLESQRGKTYTEIVAKQPRETVQGSLLKLHYQEIKTVLAAGLRLHLNIFVADTIEKQSALTALNETFDPDYLANDDFKVNFNVDEVMDHYQRCIDVGALPQVFATRLIDLAKYERPALNVSREDCAAYFGGNIWNEIDATEARLLKVRLLTATPEPTLIVVQMKENYGDGESDWVHATTLRDIGAVRQYVAELPYHGFSRRLRWRCEYAIAPVVSVA
jgi:hypothetical protein